MTARECIGLAHEITKPGGFELLHSLRNHYLDIAQYAIMLPGSWLVFLRPNGGGGTYPREWQLLQGSCGLTADREPLGGGRSLGVVGKRPLNLNDDRTTRGWRHSLLHQFGHLGVVGRRRRGHLPLVLVGAALERLVVQDLRRELSYEGARRLVGRQLERQH